MLLRAPGFTTVAVLTLALGIGANAAIFSVVNGMLLAPLPYPEPDQLVQLYATNPTQGWDDVDVSPAEVEQWREQSQLLEGIAPYGDTSLTLTGQGEPLRLSGLAISHSFFSVLHVRPALGRDFRPEEDRPGADKVALLSHALWQRHFGADPTVLGQKVALDAEPYTVIGVLPADFTFRYEPYDIFVPLALDPSAPDHISHHLDAIARIKSGHTVQELQAELDTIAARLAQADPAAHAGWGARAVSLYNEIFDEILRTILTVMSLAVGFVLLIACANVANLLLARAATREREVAIRAALGAGRLRLIRQLITESLLLALLGGAAGLLGAMWGIEILATMPPPDAPRGDQIRLDATVFLYAVGLSLFTGVLFGLVPAWRSSRPNLMDSLRDARTSSSSSHRLLKALVVSEVALALVLLAAAGLMVRSFRLLLTVDPGFRAENLLTLRTSLPDTKYPERHQRAAFYQQALASLESLPGVRSAAAVATIPLGGSNSWTNLTLEGQPRPAEGEERYVGYMVVSPNYFRTLGVSLLAGRDFTPQDTAGVPLVAIINSTLARQYWPGQDPIGKRFQFGNPDNPYLTVVGIVGDVRHQGLGDEPRPELYRPHSQAASSTMFLLVRTESDPLALVPAARERIWAVDPDQPVYRIRSMQQIIDERLIGPRAGAQILGVLAGLALLLAAVGIYGVMSYSVNERTHEVGIRMALGAAPPDILRLVVRQAMLPVLLGVGLGLAGGLAATRGLTVLLYGVSPGDPLTFVSTTFLLVGIALLACYLPARRATRVDPMVALRYE